MIECELRTSQQWNVKYQYKLIDYDGWDRTNFDYSFKIEKITEPEFIKRVSLSTISYFDN